MPLNSNPNQRGFTMKQYKDLDLNKIAKEAGLDFAHWSCRGNSSCCVDILKDFPQKYFTKKKEQILRENFQYLLFANSHNRSGDVKKDYVICYQSDEHNGIYSRLYPVYVFCNISSEDTLNSICDLLQEQLGDKYEVVKPTEDSCLQIRPLFTEEEAEQFLKANHLPRY